MPPVLQMCLIAALAGLLMIYVAYRALASRNNSHPKEATWLDELPEEGTTGSTLNIERLNTVLANWKYRHEVSGEGVPLEEMTYYEYEFREALRQGYHSEFTEDGQQYLTRP